MAETVTDTIPRELTRKLLDALESDADVEMRREAFDELRDLIFPVGAAFPHAEAPPTPKAEGSCLLCGHLKPFAVFVNGRIDDPLRPVWIGCCEDCRRRASTERSEALRVLAAELLKIRHGCVTVHEYEMRLADLQDNIDELVGVRRADPGAMK